MSQPKAVTGLSGRYAAALFDLADAAGSLDVVRADLEALRGAIAQNDDLRRVLRSPVITRQDQENAMAAVLDRFGAGELTGKIVGLLCRKRRLFILPDLIGGYLALLAAHRGEVNARVTSATPLKPAQVEAVTEALKEIVGATVKVDMNVDPSVLGGLIVKVGSRVYDASVRTKLSKLELAMKGVA